jgi:membrane protein DedA with SNARE-associated domain
LISGIFIVTGVIKMPFSRFLAADVAVTILAMTIWIVLGYVGGGSLLILAKDIRRVEHYFILLAIIFLSLYLFYRQRKNSRFFKK